MKTKLHILPDVIRVTSFVTVHEECSGMPKGTSQAEARAKVVCST